jgi:F-type H+-transporting ATPase subunit alpha
MAVQNQVAVIFAVTNGYLDKFPVERMRQWERGFHETLAAKNPQILGGIRETGALGDELKADLIKAIEEYNSTFAAELEHAGATA